jgi:hypothetical protein
MIMMPYRLPCLVETDALHLPASARSGGPILHRITPARPHPRIVSHPRAICALIESGHRASTRKPL